MSMTNKIPDEFELVDRSDNTKVTLTGLDTVDGRQKNPIVALIGCHSGGDTGYAEAWLTLDQLKQLRGKVAQLIRQHG